MTLLERVRTARKHMNPAQRTGVSSEWLAIDRGSRLARVDRTRVGSASSRAARASIVC